jgi:hypothetical protein
VTIGEPAPRPCDSCPYRRDVPSGIWAASEYDKLPLYDAETYAQPGGVFLCHQGTNKLCAGWCAVHDMGNTLGLRMALVTGHVSREVFSAAVAYQSPVPVFASGLEAMLHGEKEIAEPGPVAEHAIAKLERQRTRP